MGNIYPVLSALIGGAAGALDKIDGATLADGDAAIVILASGVYHYHLNATSGEDESSPDIISPDDNAGDKRWILGSINVKGFPGLLADEQHVLDAEVLAAAGVNSGITSMTGLDDDGIPVAKVADAMDKTAPVLEGDLDGGGYDIINSPLLTELTDGSETTLHFHPHYAEIYGVSWDESQATGGYLRTGTLAGLAVSQTLDDALIPIHALMRRCILSDAGEVQYYLGATDSTKKQDMSTASVLDGTDGQVMVEIPAFYYRYGYAGTTHTWEISLYKREGFNLHPAFIKNGEAVAYRYIGAYEGVGWDDSVSAYIDSGCVAATNWSGTTIDLANDKLGSVSGFCPMVDETRAENRSICANVGTGWRQQDFDLTSAIQLLYITEYADWNSQSMIGMGRTELSGGTWTKDSYIGVTGKSNSDGNGTNSVGGNTNDAYMTYRGIENFFGNVYKWVDGININDNVPYVCNTDTDFADNTTTDYTDLGITLAASDDYQVTLEQSARGFLPASVGGSSSTYITDSYFQSAGWRVARHGGNADSGTSAGVMFWVLSVSSSYDFAGISGRLAY